MIRSFWRASGISARSWMKRSPQYDFHALFADHPSDMIGFYIQALMKENMSPVEKKALYYGIHALLMTKDERS